MDTNKKERKKELMFVLILFPLFAFGGCALLGREMLRYDQQPVDNAKIHDINTATEDRDVAMAS